MDPGAVVPHKPEQLERALVRNQQGGVPQPRGRPRLGCKWDTQTGKWVPDTAAAVHACHQPQKEALAAERSIRNEQRMRRQASDLEAARITLAISGPDGLKGHQAKALLRAAGKPLNGDKAELILRWKAYAAQVSAQAPTYVSVPIGMAQAGMAQAGIQAGM
eukprot:CAMPEP_0183352250 /NCGR_PEP_ID=MMETSP0164_2-20130417/28717_1 /TAXON_ID=221442 /ORGANISM="Coccolithus pelagicus ssp braarudi, Strain PLY182g" /LENGTH=161 /DNA_ID=CAMNT_0025524639 /DNA_START=28 /DNA_END=510 /DNA_ORIENTATION=-